MAKAQEGLEGLAVKWNVSVLRRSGECERIEVADFELSEFFNRIASAEGKAWVLSVERVGDVGDSALVEPDGDELVSQLAVALARHGRPGGRLVGRGRFGRQRASGRLGV